MREIATRARIELLLRALAKIERGHVRDLNDVRAMLDAGLVTPDSLHTMYEQAAADLYRYPAADPVSYRAALDALLAERVTPPRPAAPDSH